MRRGSVESLTGGHRFIIRRLPDTDCGVPASYKVHDQEPYNNTPDLHSLEKGSYPLHLYKLLPTVSARRVATAPIGPTTSALEAAVPPTTIHATLAIGVRPNGGVRGEVSRQWATAVGTSQAHTVLPLELDGLLEPKL